MKKTACIITKGILPVSVIIALIILTLAFPSYAFCGAKEGLLLCTKNLIPSLFPMCCLSVMLCDIVFKMKINSKGKIICAVLLSSICGYPVGAKIVNNMFAKGIIDRKTAKLLICLCVNPGPAFVIIFIGKGLYNCTTVGYYLFIGIIIAYFLPFIILWGKINPKSKAIVSGGEFSPLSAIEKSADCTLSVCAVTVFFYTVFGVMNTVLDNNISNVIKSVCEITCGVAAMQSKPYIIAFLLGFGGLSVHAQIYSSLQDTKPNYLCFITARVVLGLLSMTIFIAIYRLFPIAIPTSTQVQYNGTHATLPTFCSLILTVSVFLYSIGKRGIVKEHQNMV